MTCFPLTEGVKNKLDKKLKKNLLARPNRKEEICDDCLG